MEDGGSFNRLLIFLESTGSFVLRQIANELSLLRSNMVRDQSLWGVGDQMLKDPNECY